jgi:hypothetical protein
MPCIRNENGQAVPGAKGSCPINSTWSDVTPTADTAPTADAGSWGSGWGALKSMDTSKMSDWARSRYVKEDGSIDYLKAGIEASWLYPGALLAKGGLKGIPLLMKQMFTKPKTKIVRDVKDVLKDPKKWKGVDTPPWSAYKTIKTKTKAPAMRYDKFGNEVQKRALSPTRATLSAAAIGMGGQGWDYVAPFTERGKAEKAVRDANTATRTANTEKEKKDLKDKENLMVDTAQAEKERVAGLSFTEKMKEPGYWDEIDATGLNRIERLGQLMDYYGKTPKQRAATTSPADRWAEMSTTNAATAASIQKSLKTVNNPMSSIGNKQSENMIASIVEKRYGNTKIPGDVMFGFRKDKKTLESITSYISARMNALIDAGGEWDASLQQAIEDYEKIQDEF